MKLLSVDEARARILEHAAFLGGESLDLSAAQGRFLARDIRADRDQPPFAGSAMDGWALRSADAPGALKIIGESAAGRAFEGALSPGEAVRIFTGAPVPRGADTVVIQEDATREEGRVRVPTAHSGQNVRPAGQDFRAGDLLLARGQRLDPWRLSLAAAAGQATVSVARRPRVAILSTGEEVVEAGAAPGPYQIFNSGTPALAALVAAWGGEPVGLRPVGDDVAATAAAVEDCACDLIITLGGASVGDYDLVKPAMARLGLTPVVESVAVRPGRPTWFGVLGDGRRVLGLPGNPASALVCAQLFAWPYLRVMLGADPTLPLRKARTCTALGANTGREHWMRARLVWQADGGLGVEPLRDQDSSLVTIFAAADALLRRVAGAPEVAIGEVVDVLPLDRMA